jgi:uncharacterized membrane protein YccC
VRVALSHTVLNGVAAALGLLLISSGVHLFEGAFAASVASIGVIVCIAPDQPAPRRGKFRQLLPAALFGLPLFMGVQALHTQPVALGLLLVPATFVAFLGGAWGKRGLPLVVSAMFAMVFSLAVPPGSDGAPLWRSGAYFALGAALYVAWATLANVALNARYRTLVLADTLLALAALMRKQAGQFTPQPEAQAGRAPLIGELMRQQAALSDQLQSARDIALESPRTARRQQLAGMLLLVLEMRDHLLACALDLDILKAASEHATTLSALREALLQYAAAVDHIADAMLLMRLPQPVRFEAQMVAAPVEDAPASSDARDEHDPPASALVHSLAGRIANVRDETLRLSALARGEVGPDLAAVRAAWQLFVSPSAWSWRPLAAVWRHDAPPLRHAVRAALAIGVAYGIGFALPWGTHDYWILLTVVVVLRGSLAQTLERRNSRVAGTLLGCLLAAALPWREMIRRLGLATDIAGQLRRDADEVLQTLSPRQG